MTEGAADSEDQSDEQGRDEPTLLRRLAHLERFLAEHPKISLNVQERCQLLQQRIQMLETSISRAGERDDVRRFLEDYTLINSDGLLKGINTSTGVAREGFNPISTATVTSQDMQSSLQNNELDVNRGVIPSSSSVGRGGMISNPAFDRSQRSRSESAVEMPPCLRCRILKKKCDRLKQCQHCPQQSDENEGDYWKVLGCQRGPLNGLRDLFWPVELRAVTSDRRGATDQGEEKPVGIAPGRLFVKQPQSSIAELFDMKQNYWDLEDKVWMDQTALTKLSVAVKSDAANVANWGERSAASTKHIPSNVFDVPWYIILALSLDPIYLSRTEYNIFSLLREGSMMSSAEPETWSLFELSKNLVVKAVEVLYHESNILNRQSPHGTAYAAVNINDDISEFLDKFESVCSNRGKLSGHQQLSCLYALLLFSVVKSLLIDTFAKRCENEYRHSTGTGEKQVTRINSAYKVLVSVFAWASKSDIRTGDEQELPRRLRPTLYRTWRILRQDKWEEKGIKSTKDFLLWLGPPLKEHGAYNGFFVQKLGTAWSSKLPSDKIAPFEINLVTNPPADQLTQSSKLNASPSGVSSNVDVTLPYEPWLFQHDFATPPLGQKVENNASGEHAAPTTLALYPGIGQMSVWDSSGDDRSMNLKKRKRTSFRADRRAEVAVVRSRGACWRCKFARIKCDGTDVCHTCQRVAQSVGRYETLECNRSNFVDFAPAFIPEFLYSHLNKPFIEQYVSDHTAGFTDTSLDVEVTWDGWFTRVWIVQEFTASTWELVKDNTQVMDGRLQVLGSVPVGIVSLFETDTKKFCKSSLDATLVNQALSSRVRGVERSNIREGTLNAILRYFSFENAASPLRNALLLLLTDRLLGRVLTLTKSSALRVRQKIRANDTQLDRPYISSRLLDLQIKHILLKIARELVAEVLKRLEKHMGSRLKDSWPGFFSVLLLLCFIIEEIQIAAIASVDVQKVAGKEPPSKRIAVEGCQILENTALRLFTQVFHHIYKTEKRSDGMMRKDGLNPLNQIVSGETSNLDSEGPAAREMIREIGQSVIESYSELQKKNQPPNYEAKPEVFALENSGRLVSKFLLSFLDNENLDKLSKKSSATSSEEIM